MSPGVVISFACSNGQATGPTAYTTGPYRPRLNRVRNHMLPRPGPRCTGPGSATRLRAAENPEEELGERTDRQRVQDGADADAAAEQESGGQHGELDARADQPQRA